MCTYTDTDNNEQKRLRRSATHYAALGGTLAVGPALGMTTHHPVLAWITIGVQLGMIALSRRALLRARRLDANPDAHV